jgi:hypothetical protein
MNYIPFTVSAKGITLIFDNKNHVVSADNASYTEIVRAIKEKRWVDIPSLVDKAKQLEKKSDGKFELRDGLIYINGELVPNSISTKIMSYMNQGFPFEPIVNFWDSLSKNPSYRARNALLDFLDQNGHPLTEDGCFVAYKRVTEQYFDFYTRKLDNSRNKIVKMLRKDVDDDPTHTCSRGLHVANLEYAERVYCSGQGRLIYVKVNPEHVVAIPTDYNGQKMRVCEYEVLGDFAAQLDDNALVRINRDSDTGLDEYENEDEQDDEQETEYEDGYSAGFDAGKNDAQNKRSPDRSRDRVDFGGSYYEEGYDEGYNEGYQDGCGLGVTNAQEQYDEGYTVGYETGEKDALDNATRQESFDNKTPAWAAGWHEGYARGTRAINESYDYQTGHEEGVEAGRSYHNRGLPNLASDALAHGNHVHSREFDAGFKEGFRKGWESAPSQTVTVVPITTFAGTCVGSGCTSKATNENTSKEVPHTNTGIYGTCGNVLPDLHDCHNVDYENGYDMGYNDHKRHTKKFDALGGDNSSIRKSLLEGYEAGWNQGKEDRRNRH